MIFHRVLQLQALAVCLILLPLGHNGSAGSTNAAASGQPSAGSSGQSRSRQRDPKVTVSLVRQARLSVGDAGLVSELRVQDGQEVAAGDVILSLDDRPQQQQLATAKLNLQMAQLHAQDETAVQSAEAQLREAEAGQRLKEVALKIAEAEAATDVAIQIADAETQLRQLELERAEGARKSFRGSISESQIDRLRTSVRKGTLERQAARDQLQIAKMKPEAEQAAIQQKKDEVRRYDALLQQKKHEQQIATLAAQLQSNELRSAELQLAQRHVTAPFEGVIVETATEVSEWVDAGTVVARLLDLQTLQVEGFLSVADVHQGLLDQQIDVQLSNGKRLKATIVFVSPEVDSINQQVRFRAEFDNSDRIALPGMKGTAKLPAASSEHPDQSRQ